jgi:ribokinase
VASRICVVGSINMDLVVHTPRFPEADETILGGPFGIYPGGKGANQAVAAAMLGADVSFVGAVGNPYGQELLDTLDRYRVDRSAVSIREDIASGVGVIRVLPSGDNNIVVAPGANHTMTAADVERADSLIERADVLILQLEIPDEANIRALEIAGRAGTVTNLNAAPAAPLPAEVLSRVDVLIANRLEAGMLVGGDGGATDEELCTALLSLGPAEATITLGEAGAIHADGDGISVQGGFEVTAVDTTACGDAFTGAWAVAHARGDAPSTALRLACAAGALAACRNGAMPSMPTAAELAEFLSDR